MCPTRIVEILFLPFRRCDLGGKHALDERFGVPEARTVDPKRLVKTASVLDAGHDRCLDQAEGVVRASVVPGSEIDLATRCTGL